MGPPTVSGGRRQVATACRVCAVGCGTLVDIDLDSSEVVGVSGDPDDPWSLGYMCAHGRAAPAFHHAVDRLDAPLWRRDGVLVTGGWTETLDDIGARIRDIVDRRGPDAVAHYTGTGGPLDASGYTMAHGFFRSLGTAQNYSALSIDCPGKFLVPELVAGVQLPFHPDMEHGSLLLAVGVNTVVSHGHGIMMANPIGRLREFRARGGSFVVIDPRRSESAAHADLHVAARPGTDPALLAFLVRQVLARGGDESYLAACADADGVARLRAAVEPFGRGAAATICGVDGDVLDRLDAMVAAAGRVSIETGTGVSMGRSGNLTEWLVWALSAVTGSLDREGGAVFNPGFLRPIEHGVASGGADRRPGPPSRPDLPRLVNGEMPCAALADEIDAGSIRALIVRAGNPALAIPDTDRIRAALAKLELLVVIDARVTETASLATHVLPMADHFERSDLVTGYLQAIPFLRHAPAVVAPIGERRPQWWIFAELSRRLGLPLFGSARVDAQLAERRLSDDTIAETVARAARRPWAEVHASPYGVRDGSVAPGWLIPGALPRPLDLAPAELVAEFAAGWSDRLPAEGQLVMINRRTPRAYNSFESHAPLRDHRRVLLNSFDAERHGLADGDRTTISTASGSCVATVEVTDRMARGVVSLPHGSSQVNVNALTTTAGADRLTGMPILSGFVVTLSGPLAV